MTIDLNKIVGKEEEGSLIWINLVEIFVIYGCPGRSLIWIGDWEVLNLDVCPGEVQIYMDFQGVIEEFLVWMDVRVESLNSDGRSGTSP